MKFIPGPETRAAVLRHPFVLAGLAVVVLLGVTAGALVVVDSARGGTEAPKVIIEQETVTPGPVVKTAEATGVHQVYVNGVLTVDEGRFTGATSGQLLRSGRDTDTVTPP